MREQTLLAKLKNRQNYKNPNTAVVLGILYTEENAACIINQLNDMLRDNFLKTQSILGEELTNLVLSQKKISYTGQSWKD